jgi:predicted Ser/Thr protein kinase
MDDTEQERRALTLFEAMLEMAEDEREAWLDANTRGDPELRRRITHLASIDTSVSLQTGGAYELDEPAAPPERIGAYRIEDMIGAGGMGSVYAARREAGDFDHQVAIKIIKPGVLSDKLVDRFNRERQILARLNHPNIARLFDGGTVQDGQPYFVMERVDGVPLDTWLSRERPEHETRIALFLQVCDAVGHAHRNLIVHRDLTPANVLVDREGNAKLIDFGIARPDGDPAFTPLGKGIAALSLTPGYAAPERLEGRASTVSSDIYSAGKLLGEIAPSPHDREIGAIVGRACAHGPDDRYLSMDALADDVRRYRDQRPVAAMPPRRGYAARKWVDRNTPLAAALGAVVLALMTGAATTAWYWQQAEASRAEAEERFDEVRGIATFMLFDLYDELAPVDGNTRALSRIADESRAYLERLAAGDDQSPELRLEIAQGYHRLSNVSGNPESSNLGRRDDARRFLDRAIADLERLHAEFPGDSRFARALASAFYSDAILRFVGEDDSAGAIVSGDRSADLYKALAEADPSDDELQVAAYRSRLQAAKPLVWLDRGREGVTRLAALATEVDAYVAGHPDDREARRLSAALASEFGNTSSWTFPLGSAEFLAGLASSDRAIARYNGLIADAAPAEADSLRESLIAALFVRALILSDLERWGAAQADLDRAKGFARDLIARDPDDFGAQRRLESLQSQELYVLAGLGRTADAVSVAAELYAKREGRAEANPDNAGHVRDAANALQGLADTLADDGQHRRACARYDEALTQWRAIEARWGLSSVDRDNSMKPVTAAIGDCRRRAL